jgi:protein-disulfide isomerase
MTVRTLLLALLVAGAPGLAPAQDAPARYLLRAEDGNLIQNSRIDPALVKEAEKLPGAVVAANPQGDVTLVEFYDLNCPYCRRASADVDAMVKADRRLRLVLVPFPVLGIPSILAGRVELAVAKTVPPAKFYEFHRAIYAGRGTIDGQRALAVATDRMGLDAQTILDAANDDGITDIMKAHVRFADRLGSRATPLFLVQDVAIDGHPGKKTLQGVIAAARKCGKAVC